MLFILTDSPQKLKLEKINSSLIILFYVIPSSPQLQIICFFVKNTHKNHFSTCDWWEYINPCFKENARKFSKDSTTQENIRNSKLKNRL